jgi:2-aminobenzoate-CoA ligase
MIGWKKLFMNEMKDLFVRNNLPPLKFQPELIHLEDFSYPKELNCAGILLDDAIEEGFGDKIAVIMDNGEWTYSELQKDSNRIAQVLIEDFELVPGNRVLLRSPNCYAMMTAWLGIVKAGCIVVPTMPLLREVELRTIINKAKVSLAICDCRLLEELPLVDEMDYISFNGGELDKLAKDKSGEFDNISTSCDDPCLISFTSGTTGKPKAVVRTHQDLISSCLTYSRNCLSPGPEDRFIGTSHIAFGYGLGGLVLFPLDARATTILIEQFSPNIFLEAAEKHKATIMFSTPTAYRFILSEMGNNKLEYLKTCVSAGEYLPKPTFEKWKDKTGLEILDGMGSTEMGGHIVISSQKGAIKPGSSGIVVPGYEAIVVDNEMNSVPNGTIGNLVVKGPTGCIYLDDERQLDYVRDGWNFTGDLYKKDEDGFFWFQSRSDDMIISSGYNIGAPEVETALMSHPAVMECAVVGVPDEHRGSLVKAFVVTTKGNLGSETLIRELQDFVKQNIAPYKYPRHIEFVNNLPKTGTGKIQRSYLRLLDKNKIEIILNEKEFPNLVIKNERPILIEDKDINSSLLKDSRYSGYCPVELYKDKKIAYNVIQITSENFNSKIQQKIQNGLDVFNNDLDEFWWKSMEEVKKRLNNNWIFNTIEDGGEIVSWGWFDPNKDLQGNQYTFEEYRNKGMANSITREIIMTAKQFNKKIVYGYTDQWNYPQEQQLKRAGWVELQPDRITKEKYEERIEYDKNKISK